MSKHIPGIGCQCCAHSENECCCPDVDWRSAREVELEALVKKLKAELKSIDGALDDPRANLTLTTSEIIWELKEQVEKLTKERDALVDAIDNEMVVTHMGVFNPGDDPKVALNKICCYAQDLGKFFAEDACKEQLAVLAEQNEKMREALAVVHAQLVDGKIFTQQVHRRPYWRYSISEALSLPDLVTPVLNETKGNK